MVTLLALLWVLSYIVCIVSTIMAYVLESWYIGGIALDAGLWCLFFGILLDKASDNHDYR